MQMQKALTVKLGNLIFWLFALSVAYVFACRKIKAVKDSVIPVVVSLTGFTAMTLQLLTIYSFEAIYGYIYFMIGLLIAAFMGGLAFGSYFANTERKKIKIELIIAILLLATALFGLFLKTTPKFDYRLSEFLIPVFSFIFAILVGAVFPAAVKLFRSKSLEDKAGVLYGCDLLGGAISAVVTSILFMPVFGIMGTIAIPISLCLISLMLLAYSSS
jgi:spermidine synthase